MQRTAEVPLRGVDAAAVQQSNSRNRNVNHNRSGAVVGAANTALLPGSSLYPAVYAHKPYQRQRKNIGGGEPSHNYHKATLPWGAGEHQSSGRHYSVSKGGILVAPSQEEQQAGADSMNMTLGGGAGGGGATLLTASQSVQPKFKTISSSTPGQ